MHRIIIFDDDLGQLGPMTELRACFEVRTGMFTTAGRIVSCFPRSLAAYWVPDRLRDLVAGRADAPVNALPAEEVVLCVNGRWALPDASLRLETGEAAIEETTGQVIVARLRHADAEYLLSTGQLHERVRTRVINERVLYKHPWDVIALMKQAIAFDVINTRLPDVKVAGRGVEIVGEHPVEIHASARTYPHVTLDAEGGPIIIHDQSVIRPGAVVCGPSSIGPGSIVADRALIKPYTVLGPRCKVGGEVGATIFQGYANKAHDGHLADSWVGKWVNFGAGTTNSNLLNTYGEVSMRLGPGAPRQRTGLHFLGAIVGDHVKFAINTRIMTGSVFGTGAMIACSSPPPASVRPFAWLTDSPERVYRIEKFLKVMQAVMSRRDRTPTEAYVGRVRALHEQSTAAAPDVPASP